MIANILYTKKIKDYTYEAFKNIIIAFCKVDSKQKFQDLKFYIIQYYDYKRLRKILYPKIHMHSIKRIEKHLSNALRAYLKLQGSEK